MCNAVFVFGNRLVFKSINIVTKAGNNIMLVRLLKQTSDIIESIKNRENCGRFRMEMIQIGSRKTERISLYLVYILHIYYKA
jgi:hypothetical protein